MYWLMIDCVVPVDNMLCFSCIMAVSVNKDYVVSVDGILCCVCGWYIVLYLLMVYCVVSVDGILCCVG